MTGCYPCLPDCYSAYCYRGTTNWGAHRNQTMQVFILVWQQLPQGLEWQMATGICSLAALNYYLLFYHTITITGVAAAIWNLHIVEEGRCGCGWVFSRFHLKEALDEPLNALWLVKHFYTERQLKKLSIWVSEYRSCTNFSFSSFNSLMMTPLVKRLRTNRHSARD